MDRENHGLPPGVRGMRLATVPRYSLVLVADGPTPRLEASLAALIPACRARDLEIVVVRAATSDEFARLSGRHPYALWMPAADGSSRSQLRSLGMAAADGDIAIFIDDESFRGTEWLDEWPCNSPTAAGPNSPEASSQRDRVQVTVVVAALNAEGSLRRCLAAITSSSLPRQRYELVVVDDGSTDLTSLLAAEHADRIVRLAGKPHGPAYARNRGLEQGRGSIVVFVDSDVVVHRDALSLMVGRLENEPDVSAVYGSYDDQPAVGGMISQYRNLHGHYLHRGKARDSDVFWAALGAVRRNVLHEMGLFDEWLHPRIRVEDVELGRRLCRSGHRIVLDPAVQGTHLKDWNSLAALGSDVVRRSIPRMWLLRLDASGPAGAGVRQPPSERLLTAAAALLPPVLGLAALTRNTLALLLSLLLVSVMAAASLPFLCYLRRIRGMAFALSAMPLHAASYAANAVSWVSAWLGHGLLGRPAPPPEVEAHSLIGIETWPPAPRRPNSSIWNRGHGA